jgi:hypothetical protein
MRLRRRGDSASRSRIRKPASFSRRPEPPARMAGGGTRILEGGVPVRGRNLSRAGRRRPCSARLVRPKDRPPRAGVSVRLCERGGRTPARLKVMPGMGPDYDSVTCAGCDCGWQVAHYQSVG